MAPVVALIERFLSNRYTLQIFKKIIFLSNMVTNIFVVGFQS